MILNKALSLQAALTIKKNGKKNVYRVLAVLHGEMRNSKKKSLEKKVSKFKF